MDKYKYFLELVLSDTCLDGNEIEHFANVAIAWRRGPEWLDVSKYVGGRRFSVYGWHKTSTDGVIYKDG